MAQGSNISEIARESQADEHKGSGFAVSYAQWYIAECKPTRERTIREMLKKVGYEVYVASQKEKHRYKSGNTRTVEHIILPGKIFVHTAESSLVDIMTSFSSVYRFQINRAATPDKYGNKPFAFVPTADMKKLMDFLDKADTPVVITDIKLKLDQEVKVVSGPLAGFEGRFYREGSATYIVIKVALGSNHYAYTEVSINDIQPMGNKS
ncbi:MAG: hypothetical protein J5965_17500 [Aeriscardovia sp.]|nr:hypothetical protein [Aeriscardovia sp.]MBO6253473.1 hypothetical protein [Bacteroidaceae bacterium]